MIYKLYLIRSGGGYAGGPIARLSQSREPVGCLRKVLCSCQRGRCRGPSASCLMELCRGWLQRRCWGSGRTERQPGPWFLGLQCRPAAGPCTYEHRYGEEWRCYNPTARGKLCSYIRATEESKNKNKRLPGVKVAVPLLFFCSDVTLNVS